MTPTIIGIEEGLAQITEQKYNAETFGLCFVEAMGANSTTLKQLGAGKTNTEIEGAILWRQKAHILAVDPGMIDEALSTLQQSIATADRKKKPRFLIATDGEYISSVDLRRRETSQIAYADLASSFNFFLPLAGLERFHAAEENPIDIKAAAKLAKLHDAILQANPDWDDPIREHDLHVLMTRLIFCFFAEDVGILPNSVFSRIMTEMGGSDGENASLTLRPSFAALARKANDRDGLPSWSSELPYANGGLFQSDHEIPDFTGVAYRILIDACRLDWGEINPDIFGSMVQAIINPKERHELGLHYTSASNIKKVIDPLFMDSLREQVGQALSHVDKGGQIELAGDLSAMPSIIESVPQRSITRSINALQEVLDRLANIRVMDPAVGSGNFLVVAYREMRRLENRIWQLIQGLEGHAQGMFHFQSSVKISRFYGIEITDFASETAKLALFITDQQMNREAIEIFSLTQACLPLPEGASITHANALRIDWEEACPPPVGDEELYIVGNPPFLGSKYQSKEQKDDMRIVFEKDIKLYKSLDFVSAFFYKAARFVENRNAQAAFVSTNSICQGQSVSTIWPDLLRDNLEIGFAHRSFRWSNSAKSNAGVTCVIVGLRNTQSIPKIIFQDGLSRSANNINAYLVDADEVIVEKSSRPLFKVPRMDYGNYTSGGSRLLMTPEERKEIIDSNPNAARFIRRLMGAQEVVKGIVRYCLWISDENVEQARLIPEISQRIDDVRKERISSIDIGAKRMAKKPHQFREFNAPKQHAILIPIVTSERREYLPVEVVGDDTVSSNANQVLYDAPEWCLSLIASKMHRAWVGAVCGKLEDRLRYSNTLGWNTFPVPDLTEGEKEQLTDCADAILAARDAHPGATIADLYDLTKMPDNLRAAHELNDETLERIYIGRRFRDDAERLEHLFARYAERKAGLQGAKSASKEKKTDRSVA